MKKKVIFSLMLVFVLSLIALLVWAADVFTNTTFNEQVIDASVRPQSTFRMDNGTDSGQNLSGSQNISFEVSNGVNAAAGSNLSINNISFMFQLYSNTTVNLTTANGSWMINRTVLNGSIVSDGSKWNFTLDTTTMPDGVYNLSLLIYNNTNGGDIGVLFNFSFSVGIVVDNKVPEVNVTYPQQVPTVSAKSIKANGDLNLSFNATVRDALSGIRNVTFQFSNGTNPFNLTARNMTSWADNKTEYLRYEVSVNESAFGGIQRTVLVTVFARDFAGNGNITQNFTLSVDLLSDPLTLAAFQAAVIQYSNGTAISPASSASRINGTDAGQNISGTAVNISFQLTNPTLTNVSTLPNNLSLNNISFMFQLYSNTTVNLTTANGSYMINRTVLNGSAASDGNRFNFTLDTTTMPDGVYNLSLLVYNVSLGLDSAPIRNFSFTTCIVVDNTVPEVNITHPERVPQL